MSCKNSRLVKHNSREPVAFIELIYEDDMKILPFVIFGCSIHRIGNHIHNRKESKTTYVYLKNVSTNIVLE